MIKLTRMKFALLVVAPLLAATLGVFWLTSDLMTRVTSKTNIADHERTKFVINSALRARQDELVGTIAANAVSDAAYRSTDGSTNFGAIQSTWGKQTREGSSYNFFALVERDEPMPIAAYKHGEEVELNINTYFKGQITVLLNGLPDDQSTKSAKVAVLDTTDGISIVAAIPAIPASAAIMASDQKPRYIIMSKLLTSGVVRSLGNQYMVTALKLGPVTEQTTGAVIKNAQGEPIAELNWRDRLPGNSARNEVIAKAYLSLGFFTFVMLFTAGLCWQLFSTLMKREAAAKYAAQHDSLTKLKNRAALLEQLKRLNAAKDKDYTLVYADIDGFKDVNDTYNHHVGDQLICHIADVMSNLVKDKGAFLARVGGDEFVALLEGEKTEAAAMSFANDVIARLKEPINIQGHFAAVGASVGIATSHRAAIEGAELMRRADVAMYEAKRTGKNRIVGYDSNIEDGRDSDQAVLKALRQIIAEKSIEVVFQPIVDARTRKIVAAETLARWPSDMKPHSTPDKFIAIAETHGLMSELGEMILQKACTRAIHLPGLRISYNLSPVQLRDPGFAARALDIIANAKLQPSQFEFEVTEGVLVLDIAVAREGLERLRSAGIRIALDDFGSGYSSIGYLQKLQFDRIKLDRAIVGRVTTGTLEQGIAHGTVLMAKGMAAEVTAEGVETEEQAQILRLAGCSEFQGYYFHKPMHDKAVEKLLEQCSPPVQQLTG